MRIKPTVLQESKFWNCGVSCLATYDEIYNKQKNIKWFKDGTDLIKRNLNVKNVNKKAKGGILFLGDGMGFTTVAAGRILDGQIKNQTGNGSIFSHILFYRNDN